LYETDGLLLFRPKSIIRKTIDLERVIENAENIYYFYLDSNWEFQFIANLGGRLFVLSGILLGEH
ncbi:MAG: hypothetical protein IKW99_07255, partial [Bacteroidales bacterium]|nr:hypothetical protein [Bacteroidales bacterium]